MMAPSLREIMADRIESARAKRMASSAADRKAARDALLALAQCEATGCAANDVAERREAAAEAIERAWFMHGVSFAATRIRNGMYLSTSELIANAMAHVLETVCPCGTVICAHEWRRLDLVGIQRVAGLAYEVRECAACRRALVGQRAIGHALRTVGV